MYKVNLTERLRGALWLLEDQCPRPSQGSNGRSPSMSGTLVNITHRNQLKSALRKEATYIYIVEEQEK